MLKMSLANEVNRALRCKATANNSLANEDYFLSHQRKVSIHFCKIVKKDMQILKNSTLHEQRFTWTESCIKSGSYVNVSNFKQKMQQKDLLLAWHCKHFCYKLHVLLNSNKCIFAQDLFYNFNKRTFFYTFLF